MNLNKSIVINWHVTERCNYGCKHCFAKWGKQTEIWNNSADVEKIITNISKHFRSQGYFQIRLNIVGGEPIMCPERLWNVVETAYKHNMETSIITNGSHLENIRPFAHLISQVGISVDSLDHQTNLNIGRESEGKTISFEQLHQKIEDIRKVNPDIKIKLNTVVNMFNYNEILVDRFAQLHIDKWKIFRQMPFNGNGGISDYKFYAFIRNNYNEELLQKNVPVHQDPIEALYMTDFVSDEKKDDETSNKQVIFIEDNKAMTESYLMISPDGRFFQNGSKEYSYSRPLTEVSLEEALSDIKFDSTKFEERYEQWSTTIAVNEANAFFHVNDDDIGDFDCFCELKDD